jgi:8-oxo-dGTP pyrophosphatase MutT (NUDIX family)
MTETQAGPTLSLVDMLRDEFRMIHGPLDEAGDGARAADRSGSAAAEGFDRRLRDFHARVHALDPPRSALCLSGGGIRSASFCLGVLQALARSGTLERFHYLSTVSGGGYIGAWLTAWIHRHFKQVREQQQTEDGEPRREVLSGVSRLLAHTPGTSAGGASTGLGGERPPEPEQVSHLRRFTNYLSPRTGLLSLDSWTLVAVYLRNLALNWLVLVPLLLAVVSVPHLVRALLEAWPAAASLGATGLAVLGPSAVALGAWAVMVALTVGYGRFKDVTTVEEVQRGEALLLAFAVAWAAVAALVLSGPPLLGRALAQASALGAGGGALTVVLKKLGDHLTSASERGRRADLVRVATVAAAAVTLATLLVGLSLAVEALHGVAGRALPLEPAAGPGVGAAPLTVLAVAAGSLVLSALAALLVDMNEFSLHALYRNRLVRAFLGASRQEGRRPDDGAFHEDDDLDLVTLWPAEGPASGEPHARRPHLFHVINATLNDVAGTRTEWSERKGVSFTFSPLHVGAHVVGRYRSPGDQDVGGYRRLRVRPDARKGDPLTLGTAMAISGAAANPNMGYHSSALVTALMAFFNVRLGWWMRAPWVEGGSTRLPTLPGATWRAWCSELLGLTRFNAPVVNVSDGGHFDNLGLYEMVRRRCRYIVVIDAGRDARGEFAALGEAIRKIRVDFGIAVTFPHLDLSGGGGAGGSGSAATDDGAPVHAWHGAVHYGEVDDGAPDGEIVYLRPVVTGDEPVDVQAYHRLHPAFPHESTADQWFSESQFESYRRLGEHSLQHLLDVYRANKEWPRPDEAPEVRSALPSGAAVPPAAFGERRLEPAEFCHRVSESLSLMKRQRRTSTHAGGVVYRRGADDRLSFLLVRSVDHTCRVLPKGHIEPGEDALTAAVREVREETGFELEPEYVLGTFPIGGQESTVTYFLMHAPSERATQWPHERHREPAWFTVEQAGTSDAAVPDDVRRVLARARSVLEGDQPQG